MSATGLQDLRGLLGAAEQALAAGERDRARQHLSLLEAQANQLWFVLLHEEEDGHAESAPRH